MENLSLLIVFAISVIRIVVGVAPFVAPQLAMKIMKYPEDQLNNSLLLGTFRMFGVRDIGLGVLTLFFMNQSDHLRMLIVINGLMDLGDVLSFGLALRQDSKIKETAVSSMGVASLAVIAWLVAFVLLIGGI